jgi:hypothetical protein
MLGSSSGLLSAVFILMYCFVVCYRTSIHARVTPSSSTAQNSYSGTLCITTHTTTARLLYHSNLHLLCNTTLVPNSISMSPSKSSANYWSYFATSFKFTVNKYFFLTLIPVKSVNVILILLAAFCS